MSRFGCISALTLTVVGSLSGRAAADEADEAERLFREGHALLKEQRYDEACPKFAESEQRDPASGTLLALAYCQELDHLLASAQSSYIAAAELARTEKQEDRQRAANERAEALTARLSTLTIDVPSSIRDLPGLRVTNNGVDVARSAWGRPIPTDGGTLTITVNATERMPWSSQVQLGVERDQRVVSVPGLIRVDAVAPSPAALAPSQAPGPRADARPVKSAPAADSHYWTVPHTVGWAAIGAGVASGVAALYFVGVEKSAQADVQNAFRSAQAGATWDSVGHARELDGEHAQSLAQGFGVASGVLLLGGAALVIFAPGESAHAAPKVSLAASPGVAGATCTGAF